MWVQGYLAFAAYIHYYAPGSLRLRSRALRAPPPARAPRGGRRWLPLNEAPYPGYCRAPGSSICLPLFCDCDALRENWLKSKTNVTLEVNGNRRSNQRKIDVY